MQDGSKYFEKQKDLYRMKNERMDALYDRVDPYTFYRELFPEGSLERRGHYEDMKGNGIALSVSGEKKRHFMLFDELEELDEMLKEEFIFMSPISYFGRNRSGKNARWLHAVAFDLDGVEWANLRDLLHQMKNRVIPQATFLVNSGTGLHLYYQLDEPMPMYPQNQKFLKELKFALTYRIWNGYTSTLEEPQIQGVLQGFRLVGSQSKLGKDYPVVAWRIGEKISLEGLLELLPDMKIIRGNIQRVMEALPESKMSLEEAKKKYPEWYERRVVCGEGRKYWTVKRDLYDWWKDRVWKEIRVGHRYFGIMALSIYAMKCGITEQELRNDAYNLLGHLEGLSTEADNHFTEEDIEKALEMFNESYMTFPRDDIERLTALPMPVNKRNGRKQVDHLEVARSVRDVRAKQQGKKWDENNGRPSKELEIREYMMEHPDVTKQTEIAEALGIHKNTVWKYYGKIREEIEQKKNGMDTEQVERSANEILSKVSDLRKRLGMK